jgi:acetyltransferase-like isoleucine patch superfamily enzyme
MPEAMTRQQVQQRLADFRAGRLPDRIFTCPIRPAELTDGLCYCHAPLLVALLFYIRSGLLLWLLRLPFSRPKLWMLRRCGARIGQGVHISVDVWIDPLFVDLLTVEDEVTIGVGAKISFHECTTTEFRVGRVTIRRGAVIGGFAILGPGIEVGEEAMVAGAAAVGRDIPARTTAIGNPARIVRREEPGDGQEAPNG